MDWSTLAALSAASVGAVSVMEKVIAERVVRDVRSMYLLIGLFNLPIGIIILLVSPLESSASLLSVAIGLGGGLSQSMALMLIWLSLRTEEVSRAIPVVQTFPIFVAILAATFLNESLGLMDWLAIVLVVMGAVVISAHRAPGRSVFLNRSFFLLLLASLAVAVSQVLSKEALDEMSRWNMLSLFMIALPLGFSVIALRRPFIREVSEVIRKPQSLSLVVADQVAALFGNFVRFAALAVGPVSLVSAVLATRPFFIFFYAVLLSWLVPTFLKEPLNARILAVKLVAIGMIVVGSARIVIS